MDAAASPVAALVIAGLSARILGIGEYGLMVVALAISNLSAAIVPAIAMTTTKFVSQLRGSELAPNSGLARILIASLFAVLLIDAILILVVLAFSQSLSGAIFGPANLSRKGISTVLLLAVFVVCGQQLDGVFSATLRGLEKFKIQALYELSTKSLLVVGVTVAALWFHTVEAVLAVYAALLAISTVGRAAIVKWQMPRRVIFEWPTKVDIARLTSFGGWMSLTVISGAAFFTIDRIIVGRVIGLAAAGEFALYSQLAQLCHFIPSSAFAFVFPIFSRLIGGGPENVRELRRQYGLYQRLIGGAAVGLALAIAIVGGRAIELLTGTGPRFVDNRTFITLVVAFAALAPVIAPYLLLLSMGRSRRVSLTNVFAVSGMLLLAAVFIPLWGVFGAALARLAYVMGTFTLFGGARRALGEISEPRLHR